MPTCRVHPFRLPTTAAALALSLSSLAHAAPATTIPAWHPEHDGDRPLVAIAAENGGTELTDFAIPFGVLKRAGIDTVALAAHDGPLRFRPALQADLDATMTDFDAAHPEGADYVIVPAMVNRNDPTVLAWLQAQWRKGATLVSICDGALVLANAGLLDGKTATAHWASEGMRREHYPATHWVRDVRYVADGNIVSSAGISAAMPTSLALVEALAGRERAQAVARDIDVADWSTAHDTDAFRPHWGNLRAFAVKLGLNPMRHSESVGVPLATGMDEIELAVVADAYSRTGRSQAVSVADGAPEAVMTRFGLRFLPDVGNDDGALDVTLPPLAGTAPGKIFDTTLASLATRYGKRTARGVALDFEYPGFAK